MNNNVLLLLLIGGGITPPVILDFILKKTLSEIGHIYSKSDGVIATNDFDGKQNMFIADGSELVTVVLSSGIPTVTITSGILGGLTSVKSRVSVSKGDINGVRGVITNIDNSSVYIQTFKFDRASGITNLLSSTTVSRKITYNGVGTLDNGNIFLSLDSGKNYFSVIYSYVDAYNAATKIRKVNISINTSTDAVIFGTPSDIIISGDIYEQFWNSISVSSFIIGGTNSKIGVLVPHKLQISLGVFKNYFKFYELNTNFDGSTMSINKTVSLNGFSTTDDQYGATINRTSIKPLKYNSSVLKTKWLVHFIGTKDLGIISTTDTSFYKQFLNSIPNQYAGLSSVFGYNGIMKLGSGQTNVDNLGVNYILSVDNSNKRVLYRYNITETSEYAIGTDITYINTLNISDDIITDLTSAVGLLLSRYGDTTSSYIGNDIRVVSYTDNLKIYKKS